MYDPFPPSARRPRQMFDNDFFTLGAPVGPDQPNRREDVIKVETILGNTGHHDLGRTDGPLGYWGERQEKAVKSWQGENSLKVDGLLKPGGPTISSLKQAAGGLLGGFAPPSPAEVDDHHSRLHQGEPGLLNTRPARLSLPKPAAPLDLDEQSQAFNNDSEPWKPATPIPRACPRMSRPPHAFRATAIPESRARVAGATSRAAGDRRAVPGVTSWKRG